MFNVNVYCITKLCAISSRICTAAGRDDGNTGVLSSRRRCLHHLCVSNALPQTFEYYPEMLVRSKDLALQPQTQEGLLSVRKDSSSWFMLTFQIYTVSLVWLHPYTFSLRKCCRSSRNICEELGWFAVCTKDWFMLHKAAGIKEGKYLFFKIVFFMYLCILFLLGLGLLLTGLLLWIGYNTRVYWTVGGACVGTHLTLPEKLRYVCCTAL